MNEKLEYAKMLGIEDSCTIKVKPSKKKKKTKKPDNEQIKKELLDKVNNLTESNAENEMDVALLNQAEDINTQNPVEETNASPDNEGDRAEIAEKEKIYQEFCANIKNKEKPDKKTKFSIVGVQVAVIALLIVTIVMTSVLYTDSGINVFVRSLFGVEKVASIDDRIFSDFDLEFKESATATMSCDNGIITMSGKGSVYSPCNGVVESLTEGEDGLYTMTVKYSENFSATVSGLKFAYSKLNDKVYKTVPIGYFENGSLSICFVGGGEAITCYTLENNAVIWSV